MKKKIYVIVLSLILVFAAIFVTACGGNGTNNGGNNGDGSGVFGDYDFTNPPEPQKVYDTDPGVTLDGKFDEDFWKADLNWWKGTSSDGSKSNNGTLSG